MSVFLPEDVVLSVLSAMDVEQRCRMSTVSKAWNKWVHAKYLGATMMSISMMSSDNLRLLSLYPSVTHVEVVGMNELWRFEERRRSAYELWNSLLANLETYLTDSSVWSLRLDFTNGNVRQADAELEQLLCTRRRPLSQHEGARRIRRVTLVGSVPLLCLMERRVICCVLDVFKNADEVFLGCSKVLSSTWQDFFRGVLRKKHTFRILSLPNLGDYADTEQLVAAVCLSADTLVAFSVSGAKLDFEVIAHVLDRYSTRLQVLRLDSCGQSSTRTPAFEAAVQNLRDRGCTVLDNV